MLYMCHALTGTWGSWSTLATSTSLIWTSRDTARKGSCRTTSWSSSATLTWKFCRGTTTTRRTMSPRGKSLSRRSTRRCGRVRSGRRCCSWSSTTSTADSTTTSRPPSGCRAPTASSEPSRSIFSSTASESASRPSSSHRGSSPEEVKFLLGFSIYTPFATIRNN